MRRDTVLTQHALTKLSTLPNSSQERISEALLRLGNFENVLESGEVFRIHLRGGEQDTFAFAFEDLRIIFQVEPERIIVLSVVQYRELNDYRQ